MFIINQLCVFKNYFSDLAKALLSLLIACIKGKIKMNIGLSILSDLVSTYLFYQIFFYFNINIHMYCVGMSIYNLIHTISLCGIDMNHGKITCIELDPTLIKLFKDIIFIFLHYWICY